MTAQSTLPLQLGEHTLLDLIEQLHREITELKARVTQLEGLDVNDRLEIVEFRCDDIEDAAQAQRRKCVDCRVDTCPTEMGSRAENYIVHDKVWAAAGIAPHGGCLCIGCLETRLGRQLTASDFDDVPLNDLSIVDGDKAWSWRTPRLISRMSSQRPPHDQAIETTL